MGRDYRFETSHRRFTLVQCHQCSLVFLNPLPTNDAVAESYPELYYRNKPGLGTTILQSLTHGILADIIRLRRQGRILDVGCGDGGFLLKLKRKGWDTFGVDTSQTSCKLAWEKLGNNVFNCELGDCKFPDDYFDVITFNHVLEHIRDPNSVLREVHRILKGDGFVCIGVPSIASAQLKVSDEFWLHLDLPRHIFHYSPYTLRLLLRKNGFTLTSLRRPIAPFPLDLFRSLERKYLYRKPRIVKSIASVPLLGVTSMKLIPNWRGTIQILARKE